MEADQRIEVKFWYPFVFCIVFEDDSEIEITSIYYYLKCYDAFCRRSPFLAAHWNLCASEHFTFNASGNTCSVQCSFSIANEPNLLCLPLFLCTCNVHTTWKKMYSNKKPLHGNDPYKSISRFSSYVMLYGIVLVFELNLVFLSDHFKNVANALRLNAFDWKR